MWNRVGASGRKPEGELKCVWRAANGMAANHGDGFCLNMCCRKHLSAKREDVDYQRAYTARSKPLFFFFLSSVSYSTLFSVSLSLSHSVSSLSVFSRRFLFSLCVWSHSSLRFRPYHRLHSLKSAWSLFLRSPCPPLHGL